MFAFLKKLPYWQLIAIPVLCIALGTGLNQAVLISNGDRFPVLYNNEKIHTECIAPKDSPAPSPFALLLPSLSAPAPVPTGDDDPDLCSNGGKFFPKDDVHVIMDKDSRLKALADIFDFHDATYSIGDGFIFFGEWIWGWAPLAWLVLVIRKFIEG